jgi:hypothetical protein
LLVLGVATTDATATVLRSNTSAAGTTNQVILPNNSAYVFQGTCIANVTGGSTTSGWKYEGVIKRGANAASTTLVAAVTPTVIAQDVAAATWVLAITADTTNGGIAVTVTGAAATTIRWVSKIKTTDTSIPVIESTNSLGATGYVIVNNEIIYYNSLNDTLSIPDLTSRGLYNTSVTGHNNNEFVYQIIESSVTAYNIINSFIGTSFIPLDNSTGYNDANYTRVDKEIIRYENKLTIIKSNK